MEMEHIVSKDGQILYPVMMVCVELCLSFQAHNHTFVRSSLVVSDSANTVVILKYDD